MKWILFGCLLALALAGRTHSFEVYVSDAGNFQLPPWQILKFDENGENPTVFINNNNNLNWPQDILFLEDSGVVLISNFGTGRITRHDATTGNFLNDFANGINGPTRTKIGPDGLLYVLQWQGSNRVKRYQLSGAFVDDFTTVGVPKSIGLDWDAEGNLYVSSYDGDHVRKFDTAGVDMGLFIDSNLAGPTNIWFDTNGDLLVADYDATSVKRFDANGNFVGHFLQGLDNSEGVAFLPNGDFLIGNGGTHSIKRFDANGNPLPDFVSSGAGNLINPNAIVLREVAPSAVEQGNVPAAPWIYPTAGSQFNLNPDIVANIARIEIQDMSGALLHRLQDPVSAMAALQKCKPGTYLVSIALRSGSKRTERVVVQ